MPRNEDEDDDIIEADYEETSFDEDDEDEDDDLIDEDDLEDIEDRDPEDEDLDEPDLPSQRQRDEAEGFVDYLDRDEDDQ